MSKITITKAEVKEKSGTSKRTGKPYTLRQQPASFESKRERRECNLLLGDDQPPYEPGVYEIVADDVWTVGQWGDVEPVRVLPLRKVAELPRKAA